MRINYWAPTPRKWRKIGDALLGASATLTTYAIANDIEWLALTSLFIGVAGKFLTNIFSK